MAKLKIGQINKALREVQKDLMLGTIPKEAFDMSVASSEICNTDGSFCGTAACIGGHAAMKLDVEASTFVNEASANFDKDNGKKHRELLTSETGKKLEPLFYPNNNWENWSNITPAQGVLAIENYFNGKSNPWKGVLV